MDVFWIVIIRRGSNQIYQKKYKWTRHRNTKLTRGCCLNCGHLSVRHLGTATGIPACSRKKVCICIVFLIDTENTRKGTVNDQMIILELVHTTLTSNYRAIRWRAWKIISDEMQNFETSLLTKILSFQCELLQTFNHRAIRWRAWKMISDRMQHFETSLLIKILNLQCKILQTFNLGAIRWRASKMIADEMQNFETSLFTKFQKFAMYTTSDIQSWCSLNLKHVAYKISQSVKENTTDMIQTYCKHEVLLIFLRWSIFLLFRCTGVTRDEMIMTAASVNSSCSNTRCVQCCSLGFLSLRNLALFASFTSPTVRGLQAISVL